jgi:hypothetical protein
VHSSQPGDARTTEPPARASSTRQAVGTRECISGGGKGFAKKKTKKQKNETSKGLKKKHLLLKPENPDSFHRTDGAKKTAGASHEYVKREKRVKVGKKCRNKIRKRPNAFEGGKGRKN